MVETIGFDPEGAAIRRRQAMAQALQQQAMAPADMRNGSSVVGKILEGLSGAVATYFTGQEADKLAANRSAESAAFMSKLMPGSGEGSPPPAPSMMASPSGVLPPEGGTATPAPAMPQMNQAQVPPQFQGAIAQASQRTGIPPQVLANVIQRESGWNPNAQGSAGEVGLGQIKPSTAAAPGFGVKPMDPAALTNPVQNIGMTADYLAGRFKGAGGTDWNNPQHVSAGLRAYNGGGDRNYVANVMGPAYAAALAGGGGAPAAAPVAATPAAPPANPMAAAVAGPDYTRLALEASSSNNPLIREKAPLIAQLAQANRRDDTLAYTRQRDAQKDAQHAAERGESRQWSLEDRAAAQAQAQALQAASQNFQAGMQANSQRFQAGQQIAGFGQQERMFGLQQDAADKNRNTPLPADVEAQKLRLAQAGAPQAENKFATGAAASAIKGLEEEQAGAKEAVTTIQSAQRIRGLLDDKTTGPYTGTGAEWKKNMVSRAVAAGLADGKTVASTEQLQAEIAKQTLGLASAMKGALSDKDIEFLRAAQGGGISAQPETIRRLADLQEQMGRKRIEMYNQRATQARGVPGTEGVGNLAFPDITAPAAPAAPAAGVIQGTGRFQGFSMTPR